LAILRTVPLFLFAVMACCGSRAVADSPLPVQTVFLILMENFNWSSIYGSSNAPFINNTLLPMSSYCQQYYNPPGLHPSEPNYIWLQAGTNFGIKHDSTPAVDHQSSTDTLFLMLDQSGIPWKAYEENISGLTCPVTDSYPYAVRHDPFVYFDAVRLNPDYCISHVRPYTELATDLLNNTVARYNFITPNVTNDMHDSVCSSCVPPVPRLVQGDHWLSQEIPKILASQAYSNNGAIFITFDEGNGASSDGPIMMMVLSPLAKGKGYSNSLHYTHSSTLRTMQNIFGLSPYLGDAANATDLSDLFLIPKLPIITTQPHNAIAPPGGTASFNVVAQGNPPLSYQWRKNSNPFGGPTSSTLTLTNVQNSDAAGYSVVVSNPFGSATSAVATLTIVLPPTITAQPQSTNALAGNSVSLMVSATGGAPLSYQWFFNTAPITNATNATLTLNNAQPSNSGNYTVRVSNPVDSVLSSNANLTVTIAPILTIAATDAAAAEAGLDPGTFTITRSGSTFSALSIIFNVGGSATPNSDYVALTSPVTLAAGMASTNLTVVPIDDSIAEPIETVIVTLASGANYVVGSPASATVTITDDDNLPPSVSITNPVSGASYVGPVNIQIEAMASDSDGTVAQVDFYFDGTNKLGTATSAPFGITWTNALGGTHLLSAVATDNFGLSNVSEPVSIYINSPPTVNIASPDNGASFATPANINITVNAADNGFISLVEFFVGNTLLGTRTNTPYTITFTNVAVGDYVLSARATDNEGLMAFSSPVNITVHEPTPDFADNFRERGQLTGFTNFVFGNNSSYTREPEEPAHDGAFGTNSAWISWVAPDSGLCTMTTTTNGLGGVSSLFDTVLAVYTGDVVSNLTYVASNDDDLTASNYTSQSRVTFSAAAGTTYQVAVDSYGAGQSGNIYFRMSLPNTFPIITNQPQSQVVNVGINVTFSVGVSSPTAARFQWQFNGANISNATNSTLTLQNVSGDSGGSYNVLVSNSAHSITSAPASLLVRTPPVIVQAPQTVVADPGSNALFSVSVSGAAPFNYQWRFNGSDISGATAGTFTASNVQYTNAGNYSVHVSNSLGSTNSQSGELIVRPKIVSGAPTNGGFQLFLNGTPGKSYAIEAAASLPGWGQIGSVTNSAVQSQYVDPAASSSNRLYRLRLAQ
jgi:hypothetical protein